MGDGPCGSRPYVEKSRASKDRCAAMTGGTSEARALGAKMADAWIAFARKGDPNHTGLPKWPVFSADKGPVMIFDNRCEVKNDPDRAERLTVAGSRRIWAAGAMLRRNRCGKHSRGSRFCCRASRDGSLHRSYKKRRSHQWSARADRSGQDRTPQSRVAGA